MPNHIDEAKRKLESWRKKRKTTNEAVPTQLRLEILALFGNYSWTQIGRGLKMSGRTLWKWRHQHHWPHHRKEEALSISKSPSNKKQQNKPQVFVEVQNPGNDLRCHHGQGEIALELKGENQKALRVHGSITPQLVKMLAEMVIGTRPQS